MSSRFEPSPARGQPCPCGRRAPGSRPVALNYEDCCGRWHADGATHLQAPDAEALMRSRYSAFVLGLTDYLLATWHPDTRPATLSVDEPGLRWLGLDVRRHQVLPDGRALVEFVARCKQGGRAQRLHEVSLFDTDAQGRWRYHSAQSE